MCNLRALMCGGDARALQQCDALLHVGEHVVLFWGWQSPGVPIVVEECGHFSGCCGAEATCPGSCGTAASCNEYCPGVRARARSRFIGWACES